MNRKMPCLIINSLRIFWFMVPMQALWDWRLSMNLPSPRRATGTGRLAANPGERGG